MTVKLDNRMGVYEIVNTLNNKRYVGRTSNIRQRYNQHHNDLRQGIHYNKHLQRAYTKYGSDAFTFNVLEYCTSFDETVERERHYIEVLGTEYADRGYNMAYAYTLYTKYDSNRKINKSKRKPNVFDRTDEINKKVSNSLKLYFKDNPESKINLSKKHNTIDDETIYNIKQTLHDELYLNHLEVAEIFNVSKNIVNHLCNLKCNEYINQKVNNVLINREEIKRKRTERFIMNSYREGKTFQWISDKTNVHIRSVIRVVQDLKTEHDERMRTNQLNRIAIRENSKIVIYFNMTNRNLNKTMKNLKVSKSKVYSAIKKTKEEQKRRGTS